MNEIIGGVYRVVEKIGQGGSGTVYKAYHERLEKYVVIKRIPMSSIPTSKVRNEVDVLKNLKHTYLPQVIDFIKEDDEAYTVMDFIDGSDLSAVRKNRKIRTADIIKYSVQLCEAVKYLHSQNPTIIHSDIKPGNIMITQSDDVCLIDFNISLFFDRNLKAIGATMGYASPEQLNIGATAQPAHSVSMQNSKPTSDSASDLAYESTELLDKTEFIEDDATELVDETEFITGDVTSPGIQPAMSTEVKISDAQSSKKIVSEGIDERSDIYSIGAVIYYMITGESPAADFTKIKSVRSFGRKIPEGLAIIVEKAMAFNRKNRYQKVSDMLKALQSIKKLDKQYRALKAKRVVISAACFLGMTASAIYATYGYDLMLKERSEKYRGYITTADEAILSGDFKTAEEILATAKTFMPHRADAYYEDILMAYEKGDFKGCINSYTNNTERFEDKDFENRNNLYFVLGNAHFELEEYNQAIVNYNKTLSIEPNYKDCYRDLAISHARNDNIDKAVQILGQAEQSGLSDDQLLLMQGEIEAYRGNHILALECIEKSVSSTQDEYLLFRGISVYTEICNKKIELPDKNHEKAVQLIEKNKNRFSTAYKSYALEILANQYRYLGDSTGNKDYYQKAINEYKSLTQNVSLSYIAFKNCFELQYHIGEYNDCLMTLADMNRAFPQDYWVMMNYSFTFIKRQESLKNKERSYVEAYHYYKLAEECYEGYTKNGKSDPNMDTLRSFIKQLIDSGWIEA